MADIVRKATIVLGLETGDVKLQVPDMGPLLKAREKELALIKKVGAAEEAARQAIESRTKSTANATAGLFSEIDALAAKADTQFNSLGSSLQETVAHQKKFVDSTLSSANQFLGATQQMGEGAFVLMRSVALLSSSSDQDLQKMIQKIAMVQGAFDLFKGSAQVVQGVIANMQAMRTAAAGVMTVLGPAGIAFAGLTAAGAALVLSLKDSTEAFDENTEAINLNLKASQRLSNLQGKQRDNRSDIDKLTGNKQIGLQRSREELKRRMRIADTSFSNKQDFLDFAAAGREKAQFEAEEAVIQAGLSFRSQIEARQAKLNIPRLESEFKTAQDNVDPYNGTQADEQEAEKAGQALESARESAANLEHDLQDTLERISESLLLLRDTFDQSLAGAISSNR